MKVRELLYILALITSLNLSSQAEESQPEYARMLEQGNACLLEGASDCEIHFEKALRSAGELQSDSVVGRVYLDTYNALKRAGQDYDRLISILDRGLSFVHLKDLPSIKASLLAEKGNTILDYGRDEDYMALYDSAKTYTLLSDDAYTTSQILVARARGLEVQGKLDLCINELLLAREFANKVGTRTAMAQIALGLSNAYYMNGDFELTKEQLEYCQELMLAEGDTLRYHYAGTNWANTCLTMNEPELVLDVLPQAIDYFKGSGHLGLAPYPLTQLGRAYQMLERPTEALSMLLESSEICQELGIETQFSYNHEILAHVYKDMGQKRESSPKCNYCP